LMDTLKVPEDQPIEANLISRAIEEAQSKIEGMNFDLRKHVLEYDDVMNKHREVIYKKRREILEIKDLRLKIKDWMKSPEAKKALEEKVKELGENFNQAAKFISLRTLDMLWMDHLYYMTEELRDSVRLRAYGQQDPLVEYKNEGHKMFRGLLAAIESNIANTILRVSLQPRAAQPIYQRESAKISGNQRANRKIGRNDPCPCGSGKKYKKCCMPKYG